MPMMGTYARQFAVVCLQFVSTVFLMGGLSTCTRLLCIPSHDITFNGTTLNCTNTGITYKDFRKLSSLNVTSLILSNNDIGTLPNNSFLHFKQLKRMDCEVCQLNALDVDALKGLKHLEVLILRGNYLKISNRAFPFGFFQNVPQLKTLHIDDNGNDGYASNYSQFIDIFDSLLKLTDLQIDSFRNLTIGVEFTKLKNLNRLEINCFNLETITNDSLLGFENSSVKEFIVSNSINEMFDEEECDMLFQFLPNISSLRIQNMRFGNTKLLKMLRPLQDKQIDLLYFDNVGLYRTGREGSHRLQDRIFTNEKVKYIKNVCISHFVWLNSHALLIDMETLTSRHWKYCTKSIIMTTGNSMTIVNKIFVFHLARLNNLERMMFMASSNKVEYYFRKIYTVAPNERDELNITTLSKPQEPRDLGSWRSEFSNETNTGIYSDDLNTMMNSETSHSEGILNTSLHEHKAVMTETDSSLQCKLYSMTVHIPPFLTDIVFDYAMSFYVIRDTHVTKNTLRSVAMRNIKHCHLNARIFGMASLKNIDFTGTVIKGKPTFFKWFPALRKLTLRSTQQNSEFYFQVAENIPDLEYFDIADNGLYRLPKKIFHSNKNLKYLSLASNHFISIPYTLGLTPNLETLDLWGNSLVSNPKDLRSVEDHRHGVTNFTLLMGNNQFSCVCLTLPFLRWLHHSTIHFDQGGNYTCLIEDGTVSNTASFSDTKSFWRQCYGPSYFMVSLILLTTLMAIYTATFFGMKHKTQIVSKVMQLVVPGFKLNIRQDYNFDVVIGYADQDANYVKDILLKYLEDKWHLRTFVHQRDMLQDPLMMSRVIRDSWRSLLLITENFLDHCDMAHNVMMVCTFFVHPSNPGSVIVMVEESVRHRIPDYVFQVVDEDNIIVVPPLEEYGWLDYQAKETLRTRIFLDV